MPAACFTLLPPLLLPFLARLLLSRLRLPNPFTLSLSNPFALPLSNPFTVGRWNPFVVSRADVPGGPSRTMNGFHPAPAAHTPTRPQPARPQTPPKCAPPCHPSYPRRRVSIRPTRAPQSQAKSAPPQVKSFLEKTLNAHETPVFAPPAARLQHPPIPAAAGCPAAARPSRLKVTHDPRPRRPRMFEEEFRTYDIDAPEVRALQRAMPQETFALVEGLMGRWQQAGMPLRPARRGFAFQAPHGERLTTVAWVYAPDRRHPVARIEVALDLLLRRGVDAEQIDALRDDLTRFPTHVPGDSESLVELPLSVELGGADLERLASALVQFGLALA